MNAKWIAPLVICILFFAKQSEAQYPSIRGDFEVNQQLGCHDLTVTVANLNPGSGIIIYQFDGFESTQTTNPVFTYTAPGVYWINQYIQGATGEKKDSISVTVVSPQLPEVELQSCNNLELLVQINDSYYDEYEINYGDGTVITVSNGNVILPYTYANNTQRTVSVTGLFTTATNRCGGTSIPFDPLATVLPAQIDSLIQLNMSTLKLDYNLPANSVNKLEISIGDNTNFVLFKDLDQNTSIDTVTSLSLPQNTYCFRISTYDACSNFKSYSNEICSINLNVSAQNNQLTINWQTVDIGLGQTTRLVRDGNLLTSFSTATFQYTDTTVVCNTNYCYQVAINFSGGVSQSLETCETAFSADIPPTIDNISSITNTDSIEWTWQIPPNTTPSYYKVYSTLADGSIIGNDTVVTNYINQLFTSEPKYISVQIINICDNASPLNLIGSSIFLEGRINSMADTELTWNNYAGWIDGFQGFYVVIKNKEGLLVDSVYVAGDTNYTLPLDNQNEQTLTFTVWAIPVDNSVAPSRANILTFERDPVIAIPNSFTPNGDGLNDKFVITGKFIESYEMQIFNRWGEALFNTTDLENGWDGSFGGKKAPTGNYAFWVRVKDLNNKEHIRTGSILILSN
ncbi:MAG: gliding motility-associated C-terminal domain-containing protein [Cyclobacteriaceae bacterium]|nr:gliding motility-associated C-terminal domain-containing protein [Cyclobacteriaceae bacterium]